jgi:hypothetical protein
MTTAVLALVLTIPAADTPDAQVEALAKAKGGTVVRDEKAPGRPITNVILVGAKLKDADLAPLAGIATLEAVSLGYNPDLTDAGLKVLLKSPGLKYLTLVGTGLTDAGLKELTALKGVEKILLENTKVTDAGLAHLAAFGSLAELGLGATAVTDAGVPHLLKLEKLRQLSLFNTALTDAGLKQLAGHKALKGLNAGMTKVTANGIEAFRSAAPGITLSADAKKK